MKLAANKRSTGILPVNTRSLPFFNGRDFRAICRDSVFFVLGFIVLSFAIFNAAGAAITTASSPATKPASASAPATARARPSPL